MKIPQLQEKLKESHAQFIRTLQSVSDVDFTKPVNNKWTAGQQLEHIVIAVAPVDKAFSLPRFVLRLLFGKANRASRTYDQLVEKYQGKLAAGYKASKRFTPAAVSLDQRVSLVARLEKLTASLNKRLNGLSEEQLDLLILPHPLLGKLTLREMIYFTIYHAGHHEKQVVNNFSAS